MEHGFWLETAVEQQGCVSWPSILQAGCSFPKFGARGHQIHSVWEYFGGLGQHIQSVGSIDILGAGGGCPFSRGRGWPLGRGWYLGQGWLLGGVGLAVGLLVGVGFSGGVGLSVGLLGGSWRAWLKEQAAFPGT